MQKSRVLPLILMLAACSDKAPAVNEVAAQAAIDNVQASGDINAMRGLPVADETAALDPTAIPPAFEGRWALTPADCDIARRDTPGLLIIRGNALTFYAASATARVIGGPTRYKVVADLSLQDGGRKWQRRETFELLTAGTVLQRTEQSPRKTYRYERC